MGYIICEECGGYYELQSGEFADDFENCQCGGNLKLVEDSFLKSGPENNTRFVCSNCLEENEAGLYCSNCGGRLISINNKNNETKSGSSYDMDHIERLARNSKSAYSNEYNTNMGSSKDLKNFLDRISWFGVIIGVVFYIISGVISAVLAVFFTISTGSIYSINDTSLIFLLIIVLAMIFIFQIISGALSVFISKKTEYVDGLINGSLVGIISAIILGIASGSGFLISIFISGGLTAVGGLIVIFIRNKGYLKS